MCSTAEVYAADRDRLAGTAFSLQFQRTTLQAIKGCGYDRAACGEDAGAQQAPSAAAESRPATRLVLAELKAAALSKGAAVAAHGHTTQVGHCGRRRCGRKAAAALTEESGLELGLRFSVKRD